MITTTITAFTITRQGVRWGNRGGRKPWLPLPVVVVVVVVVGRRVERPINSEDAEGMIMQGEW